MVFAASGDEALDRRVSEDARSSASRSTPSTGRSSAISITPAIVNRAPVCVAIGTEGAAPVLAQTIRAKVDQLLSPSLGALASLAASLRDVAERLLPKGRLRRQFWNDFFGGAPARAMEVGHAEEALQAAAELLQRRRARDGYVALVGAGQVRKT